MLHGGRRNEMIGFAGQGIRIMRRQMSKSLDLVITDQVRGEADNSIVLTMSSHAKSNWQNRPKLRINL